MTEWSLWHSLKPKPKPCKSRVLSKAPVSGPSRVSLPPHKKRRIHDPNFPSKSKSKPKASHSCSLSQSNSFLFLYFFSRANFHFFSSSLWHRLPLWHVCGSPSSRNGSCIVCAPFPWGSGISLYFYLSLELLFQYILLSRALPVISNVWLVFLLALRSAIPSLLFLVLIILSPLSFIIILLKPLKLALIVI